MSLPFDPVLPGETFAVVHRFTPAEVAAFASATGDTNPLHHDAAFAARSRFGGLIASGTHTTSLLLGLTASHFSKRGHVVGVEFGVKLRRPVAADAQVTMRWTVIAVTPHRGDAQMVDLEGELRDDATGAVCVTATGRVLVGYDLVGTRPAEGRVTSTAAASRARDPRS